MKASVSDLGSASLHHPASHDHAWLRNSSGSKAPDADSTAPLQTCCVQTMKSLLSLELRSFVISVTLPCLLKQTLFLVNSHPSEARKQQRVSVSSENTSRPVNLGLVAGIMEHKLLGEFLQLSQPQTPASLAASSLQRTPDGAYLPSSFDFYFRTSH